VINFRSISENDPFILGIPMTPTQDESCRLPEGSDGKEKAL